MSLAEELIEGLVGPRPRRGRATSGASLRWKKEWTGDLDRAGRKISEFTASAGGHKFRLIPGNVPIGVRAHDPKVTKTTWVVSMDGTPFPRPFPSLNKAKEAVENFLAREARQ